MGLPVEKFLLTPLREGRPGTVDGAEIGGVNFYSRPCGRGDFASQAFHVLPFQFLLTPLREGRPERPRFFFRYSCNFYSRPCGRGDVRSGNVQRGLCISTHAPAGGATSKTECVHQARNISTHAPAGGATISNGSRSWPRRFLLTPLREGRLNRIVIALMQELISTHAPAGGATADLRRCWKHRPHFYSRPCGRGDQMSGLRFESMAISTHAPAGGATAACRGHSRPAEHFYSRPCGRGDLKNRVRTSGSEYFYSRPCGRGDVFLPVAGSL